MPIFTPRIHSVSLAVFALCSLLGQAHAQSAAQADVQKLEEVIVTANPLKLNDPAAPVQRLSGDGLVLRMESSLGETLAGLPGVSSTQFGPGASRPIIRGLDADRIRILHNSNASGDASALSPDHAVTVDPLVVEAIEVLRGPATLLYGGNAMGGVINVLDNRIPQTKTNALSARLSAGMGSADRSWHSAAVLDGGSGAFAWHANAFARKAKDVNAPIDLACEKQGVATLRKRVCNSDSKASGGAFGASVFAGAWRVGASVSGYGTDYGAVSEDEVSIEMDDTRIALQAAYEGKGWVRSFKLDGFANNYKHTEFEGAEVGTVFRVKNNEIRGLLEHAPIGPFKGAIGLKMDSGELSAVGEEAFLPQTRTRQSAAFILEQASFGATDISLGARTEKVRVRSLGAAAEELAERFEARSRSFSPTSFSAEVTQRFSGQWSATGSIARSQRAPKDYELFANGPHIATAAYELGNPDLNVETATSMELGLRFKSGANTAQIQIFRQSFRNHILLDATGNQRTFEGEVVPADFADLDTEVLPEYAYRATTAVFTGFEAHGSWNLASGVHNWDLRWKLDSVRATETVSGKALPRIAPNRVSLTAVCRYGPWSAQAGVENFSAARDKTTKAYSLWDVAATYQVRSGNWRTLWFMKVKNLSNEVAYSASSILTTSAPGRVPLPGRALSVGVQASF